MLYGLAKALSRIRRPRPAPRSPRRWRRYVAAVLRHELAAGFLGGWLLGLLPAAWESCRG